MLVCAIVGLAGLLGRGTRQGEEPSEMARAMGLEEPSPVQPPPVDPRESRAESLLQFARNQASQG